MDWMKVFELFSRNWIIVLTLVLVLPVFKFGINAYLQVKIAKIQNHQRCIVSIETSEGRKSLEISSSELNIKDLTAQIAVFENPKIALLPSSTKTRAS